VFIESGPWRDFGPKNVEMLNLSRILAHLRFACGVVSALSSLPLVSQGLPRPNKSVFGVYGQPVAGHDSIRVTENANGPSAVNLKLYYSKAHTCRLNKEGQWTGDHVAMVTDGLDTNRPCRLNLFFENRDVLLKDDGFQCAPVYCGTRGKLDDASLPKFSPDRK
jgi:hypothetical protein